jgi:hypothetical protein
MVLDGPVKEVETLPSVLSLSYFILVLRAGDLR